MNEIYDENKREDESLVSYWLEQFLITWEEIPWDEAPREVQKFRDPSPWDGNIGVGKHPTLGWIVLACGQGPFVVWTEASWDELVRERRRKPIRDLRGKSDY